MSVLKIFLTIIMVDFYFHNDLDVLKRAAIVDELDLTNNH